jgi:hypothetical protein
MTADLWKVTLLGKAFLQIDLHSIDFVSLMQGRRQPRISIGLKTRRGAIAGMDNNVLIHIVFS